MFPKRERKVLDIYVTSQNEFSSIHLGDFNSLLTIFIYAFILFHGSMFISLRGGGGDKETKTSILN